LPVPESFPTTPAIAQRLEPSTVVLFVGGPVIPAAIPGLCESVCRWLEGNDANLVECDVAGLLAPDACTLDALARVALTAKRLGCRVRIRHASSELRELLVLAGLAGVLPVVAASPVEPKGQTEEWEELRGIEEEGDSADQAL
jgi:ABC-type transporter Mla MlaB component